MATFSDLYNISKDSNFNGRVQYAANVAATNVIAEDPSTSGHPARKEFAQQVINGRSIPTLTVLTNLTIAAEANLATTPGFAIPDSDIQFTVNSLWNAYSGV